MDTQQEVLRCHACQGIQRDRLAYRDHLLRVHGEVFRRGSDAPVRLERRELALVWASVLRHQVNDVSTRRREELGLPRVSDREAERRLRDNRSRTARRHRAAACARGEAATLGAPEVLGAAEDQGGQRVVDMEPGERFVAQAGSSRSELQVEPVILLRGGGTRRPLSPCERCTNCECRRPRDYSAAQEPLSLPSRRPFFSRRRPRSPTHTPSPGPPQLWRELAQQDGKYKEDFKDDVKDDEGASTLLWADAQEHFSLRGGL